MNGDSDYEEKRHVLQIEQAFLIMVMRCELEVHREILSALLENQTKDPSLTKTEILRKVENRINGILADSADFYPNQVHIFSALFDEWKKQHGL